MISNCIEKLGQILICVILFSSFVGVIISFYTTISIILSYLFGLGLCCCLLTYQHTFTQYIEQLSRLYYTHVSTTKEPTVTCEICKSFTCNRHAVIANNPWKNLFITTKLNGAVEKFYNKIISVFILSWYMQVSKDRLFLHEMQSSLKYASAVIVNRALKIDIFKLITTKIMPHVIKHIDDVLCMQQMVKLKNVEMKQVMPDYLKSRLHIATTNRKNELDYLRYLVSSLLPFILPIDNLKCKNYTILMREILAGWVLLPLMDVLADPDMINSLVLLLSSRKSKHNLCEYLQLEYVEFLQNFSTKELNHSKLGCDLKVILKNTDLLYAYMQFLKTNGPVHILQFCLDIENFNNKLLTPEMSKKQLEKLHSEAEKIYAVYFNQDGTDFIGCSSHIQNEFYQLLQDGVYNIAKLRTSEPLYHAYDYAYNILETEWLPLFFHSNQFYSYICGSKFNSTDVSMFSKSNKLFDAANQRGIPKISSSFGRIKGVLKANQPVDGSIYYTGFQIYSDESAAFVEDILLSDCENLFRDLSTWMVTVATIEDQQCSSAKSMNVVSVKVERNAGLLDNEVQHWNILRKDQDFYTLMNKLIEFHGETEMADSSLPSKRIGATTDGNKNTQYECFIKSLLQKPSLRGSDLLYTFLTTDQDFTYLVNTTVPVVEDLGNIYHSVAFKFRKEKGQHLDSFLNTFLCSTVMAKQNKFEWAEIGDENQHIAADINTNIIPATYNNIIYGDNCSIDNKNPGYVTTPLNFNGASQTIFYLLKHTLKVRPFVFKMYSAIHSLFPKGVESITKYYLDRQLSILLSQDNIADLVNVLEGIIFQTRVTPTREDREKKEARSLTKVKEMVSFFIGKVFGMEFLKEYPNLFIILQEPLCNKQLAYGLLDVIVSEVWSEFNLSEPEQRI